MRNLTEEQIENWRKVRDAAKTAKKTKNCFGAIVGNDECFCATGLVAKATDSARFVNGKFKMDSDGSIIIHAMNSLGISWEEARAVVVRNDATAETLSEIWEKAWSDINNQN